MKLTAARLKKLIKEELQAALRESVTPQNAFSEIEAMQNEYGGQMGLYKPSKDTDWVETVIKENPELKGMVQIGVAEDNEGYAIAVLQNPQGQICILSGSSPYYLRCVDSAVEAYVCVEMRAWDAQREFPQAVLDSLGMKDQRELETWYEALPVIRFEKTYRPPKKYFYKKKF